jgi:hypothetical protein
VICGSSINKTLMAATTTYTMPDGFFQKALFYLFSTSSPRNKNEPSISRFHSVRICSGILHGLQQSDFAI